MSPYLAANEDVVPVPGQPTIKEVRAFVSRSTEHGASDVHDTPDTHWIMGLPDADGGWNHESTHPPITNPMSRYPKYAGSRSSWGVARVPRRHCRDRRRAPNFGAMFTNEPLPDKGYITLPDTPGFGLELDRAALNLARPYGRGGRSTYPPPAPG